MEANRKSRSQGDVERGECTADERRVRSVGGGRPDGTMIYNSHGLLERQRADERRVRSFGGPMRHGTMSSNSQVMDQ